MKDMKVKIKKVHPDAIIPSYATEGSACLDIHSVESKVLHARDSEILKTGLVMEIPEGYVMNIYSRSGYGFKNDVRLANCVGKVDSDYRGEIMIKLTNDSNDVALNIKKGDRIAQFEVVPVERVYFIMSDELSETDRGEGGFGSTGR